jgi:hypothetical protein
MRITAAETHTTTFVQAPVRAGRAVPASRGFMNITITVSISISE